MPDPFEQLRDPDPAAEPDARFRAALRARLEQALVAPSVLPSSSPIERSTLMTTVSLGDRSERRPVPAARPALVPYLAVDGAAAALDWYVTALGARIASEPITMPDGRIGHVELELEGATFYLSDESPASHVAGPRAGADATVTLVLEVASVDSAVDRALERGATLERPAADYPHGRNAVIRDPFWHRWMISGPVLAAARASGGAGAVEPIRHGDVGYVSVWAPDEGRARRFFSSVLGFPLEGHRDVPWRAVSHGFAGGVADSTLFCAYAVDDMDAAIEAVRAGGGTAEAPAENPWGRTVEGVDPEGLRFALYELPPEGARPPRPAPNGERHGDVSYITMQVVSSDVARAFYGSVLGWRFEPGRVEDGWIPQDVAPMTGISGGHDRPSIVPMYRVDDIQDAVRRVRDAGGTATEPELQPYGWSSECHDDQGTVFYLGQH